ncbi:LRR receptor-like serine/threonine-protein kinase FLS2 [Canna indica]|uniref:LRR receptor-like serine/threonine-protein kinase FLS2 n=1 Tax=Canna indica TaxID=4628 RepID=A0AAQ3JM67_9LILI|nr:LRR receptor-like serine/threonine-protein kinase FLS2 [Canna indica]
MAAASGRANNFGSISSNLRQMLLLVLSIYASFSCCLGHGDTDAATAAAGRSGCIENERRALLAIKSDMYDPDNWFSSWTGHDCCKWRGVTCDNDQLHVVELDLHYPYTYDQDTETIGVSKVNPSMLDLKHLKYLDLSMNNFSGADVPKMITSLVRLEYLNLSNAMFSGAIPFELGNLSSLRYLDLEGSPSQLRADDLGWLSGLPSLIHLDLSFADLSQATNWLHQLNSIPTLQVLILGSANLPPLPSPLPHFNLTSISTLDLSYYRSFTSPMLTWLSNASSLHHLRLSGCSGLDVEPLQVAVGALSNLQEFDLSFNHIKGDIYGILKNVSRSVKYLDLSFNSLTGDIPPSFWSLPHLEYLSLDENDVTGHIPDLVENLTSLRHLSMDFTQISGEIPRTLGNLARLEFIDLHHSHIIGEIPPSMGNLTSLVYLDLSVNNISGWIPETFGDLFHLKGLHLSDNIIGGQLPKTIGNLHNLQELDLHNNSVAGHIPETVGRLHNLQVLILSNNKLTGTIPRSLGGLCNLKILDVSQNSIVGDQVTDVIHGLSNCTQGAQLSSLHVEGNNLSGMIPPSLGHMSQLQELYLSSNSLQGNITEAHFSNLTNLKFLNISHNSFNVILSNDWVPPFSAYWIVMSFCHLGVKFPAWIRTQTNLQRLYLARVGLSDNLPSWFSNFTSKVLLDDLDLSSNNLSGPLPTLRGLVDLSNNSFVGPIPLSSANGMDLRILILSNNHINGSIPSLFCNLTSLIVLDLSSNHLSGEIPDCNGGSFPASLQSLHLNNNNLVGRFPSFLQYCKELVALDLGENKLFGEIPVWVGRSLPSLKILRLSSNFIHGRVPVSIGSLTSLQVLDLSSNNLFGDIPSSFGNLKAMAAMQNEIRLLILDVPPYIRDCPYYTYCWSDNFYGDSITITAKGTTNQYSSTLSLVTSIDLSNNNLTGEIPKEITNLLGLHFLSLSNNYLTGRIPEMIGAMTQLESLDLSMNNLVGEIPSSLSELYFLSHLNLSYNNLSGKIPTDNQLSTFDDPSIYVGNKNLCGEPLPDQCPNATATHSGDEESGDELETILEITSTVVGFVVGFWLSMGIIIVKHSIRIALFRWMDKMCDWIYVKWAIKVAKLKSKWRTVPN